MAAAVANTRSPFASTPGFEPRMALKEVGFSQVRLYGTLEADWSSCQHTAFLRNHFKVWPSSALGHDEAPRIVHSGVAKRAM